MFRLARPVARQFAARQFVQPRYISATPAASGIVDSAKDLLSKANKKTGEALASTMDATEKVVPSADEVKEKTAEAANTANHKVGDVLADGMQKAEDLKNSAEAKAKVAKNTSGYQDLKDKGAKVESEQNRPDDAV